MVGWGVREARIVGGPWGRGRENRTQKLERGWLTHDFIVLLSSFTVKGQSDGSPFLATHFPNPTLTCSLSVKRCEVTCKGGPIIYLFIYLFLPTGFLILSFSLVCWYQGKHVVFTFIIEYSGLRDVWPTSNT